MEGKLEPKYTPVPNQQPLHSFSIMQNLMDNDFVVQQCQNLLCGSIDNNIEIPFTDQVYFDNKQEKNLLLPLGLIGNQPKTEKKRKPRVYITKDIHQRMICAFRQFQIREQYPFAQKMNLRQIAEELNISQVTILRKYRQFKQNSLIAKNALQLTSRRKSYKKTKFLHAIIDQCIKRQNFKNSPQLVSYIAQNYGKVYSRFQVFQYLKKIKYNAFSKEAKQGQPKEETEQKMINSILKTFAQNQNSLLFYAQQDFLILEGFNARVCVLCGLKGMLFRLLPIRINMQPKPLHIIFNHLLFQYFRSFGKPQRWILAMDKRLYYKKTEGKDREIEGQNSIMQGVLSKNGKMIRLPQSQNQSLNVASILIRKANINQSENLLSLQDLSKRFMELHFGFSKSFFCQYSASWYAPKQKNAPKIKQALLQA